MKGIRDFVDWCTTSPPNIYALELPFDWRIGQHSIKGAIDRIDKMPDGSIVIYDYKTGRPKLEEKLEREDKEQLRMYQLAMEEKGERVSRLALVYIQGMIITEVDLLEGNKKLDFKGRLLTDMNNILTSDYPPNPEKHRCSYCDFRNICQYRES